MANARLSRLQEIDLLITRPQPQANETAEYFKQYGLACTLMPVLEVQAIGPQDDDFNSARALLSQLPHYQHIVFISVNAVRAGVQAAADAGVSLASLSSVFWAIGEATQTALKQYGIDSHVARGSRNSEALLASPELQLINKQHILIFRGQGGRQHLAKVLASRGAKVDYCEVYRRLPIKTDAQLLTGFISSAAKPIVLAMSGESLIAFSESAQEQGLLKRYLQVPLLVPGQRVAKLAQGKGYQKIICADFASLDALYQALQNWEKLGT